MLIIICLKCGYTSADKVLNYPKCDAANKLVFKPNNIIFINPKINKWKVVCGVLLLFITTVLIFINYQALAAICFIVGFTLVLYDKFFASF